MSNTTTLQIICSSCQSTHHIQVNITDYAHWIEGELIQKALPNLTPEERELLISKTCGTCFNALFEEDETPRCDDCKEIIHEDESISHNYEDGHTNLFCRDCDMKNRNVEICTCGEEKPIDKECPHFYNHERNVDDNTICIRCGTPGKRLCETCENKMIRHLTSRR